MLDTYRPHILGILRIVAALVFMEHGTQKLFGFPGGKDPVDLMSLMGLAGILETFGGLLLLIGFQTRITAFVLSGMMAVAYWMAHAPHSFYLFCFVFLYLVFAGPGSWSVDGARR
jgi:putative oxidoreductase